MEMETVTANVSNEQNVLDDKDLHLNMKKPKRILHFSDGTLEEYSDDEDEIDNSNNTKEIQPIDEKQMGWMPWMALKAYQTGNVILAGCDYVGEMLASFLGITTSKFSSELEEFQRIEEEKAKEEQEAKQEAVGWSERRTLNPNGTDLSKPIIDKY